MRTVLSVELIVRCGLITRAIPVTVGGINALESVAEPARCSGLVLFTGNILGPNSRCLVRRLAGTASSTVNFVLEVCSAICSHFLVTAIWSPLQVAVTILCRFIDNSCIYICRSTKYYYTDE